MGSSRVCTAWWSRQGAAGAVWRGEAVSNKTTLQDAQWVIGKGLSDCQDGSCSRSLQRWKSMGDVKRRSMKEQQILAGWQACLAQGLQ